MAPGIYAANKGTCEPFSEQEEPGMRLDAAVRKSAAASTASCETKRCYSERSEVPMCHHALEETVSAAVIGESSIWTSGGNKLGPGGKPESTLCVPAASVLMGLMYGARMARYDLLRPVQSLASFLHQWNSECDGRLLRLSHMSSRPYKSVR